MHRWIKTVGNTAFVVVGFFAVFFGVPWVSNYDQNGLFSPLDINGFGIAHADVPVDTSVVAVGSK